MRPGNARRCLQAAAGTVLLAAAPAWAAQPAEADRGRPPAPAEALAAYEAARAWLDGGPAPEDPPGTAGASVALRMRGRLVGTGSVLGDERVLAAALDQARAAAIAAGVDEAAFPRLTLGIELAGTPVPLPGEGLASTAARISPGRQGISGRAGERQAVVFPMRLRHSDSDPIRGIRLVLGELDLEPLRLAELRERHGLRLARFDVVHLEQLAPNAAPRFLLRGGRVVPIADVTIEGLRDFADAIASHLLSHVVSESDVDPDDRDADSPPSGFLGTYHPIRESYDAAAAPRAQAIAAFALLRYAGTPGVDPARAVAAEFIAADVLRRLVDASDELDAGDRAALLIAWAAFRDRRGPDPELDAAAERLSASLRATLAAGDAPPDPIANAMAGFALARRGAVDPAVLPDARTEVRRLFRETPLGELVSLMPWLGWAELELADGAEAIPAELALRDLRDIVWEHQLEEPELGLDGDMAGGIVFTRGGTDWPSWHTLRPVAFLATALGEPRLTDADERTGELARLARALRFAMQLSIREGELHMHPRRGRSVGGIRRTLWTSDLGLDPASLALLATCELLDAAAR